MNRKTKIMIGFSSGILGPALVAGTLVNNSYAETCVTNPGTGPDICVDFLDAGDPDFPDDFTVDFTDEANPDVALKKASLAWNIRSDNNGSAGNIGDITLNPANSSDDFEVTIANGANPGAANVGSINLTAAFLWTGHSSIDGGEITGDLTGVLTLVEDSGGNGGDISGTFTIGGDVSGDITVPKISGTLDIDGELSSDINVTVKIDGGRLDVAGAVSSAAQITIADMPGTSLVGLGGQFATVAGDLVLQNGVPSQARVEISGEFTSLGSIDLNGKDVVGRVRLHRGGAGSIINGGEVSGQVWLTLFESTYSGTATFSSVSNFVKTASPGSLDGTINVTGNLPGTIHVEGDLLSNGLISVGGHVSGEIIVGDVVGGNIEVGGSVTLTGEIAMYGDVSGDVDITGLLDGLMRIRSAPMAPGDLLAGGELSVGAIGDIAVLSVDGDVVGDIVVNGEVDGGAISIGGTLKSVGDTAAGRVLIGGLLEGPITIAEETQALTLIRLTAGIGTAGMVTINDTRGNFNANGTIHVGAASFPIGDVTFDGKILIRDDPNNGDGGDLNGTIKVVGCHLNTPDLDICICGGDGNENVQIVQPNCDIQVDWSCVSECPL